ncbi:hypothetical protein HaLaN_02286 [Haematococcus lacustris]|uniref:Uncharacterized protein n=1 Tax=Haematococcus lacustris TaxID=44745 RepID=A0A699YBD5_HAELA|nr:hypothetical protein HaLaN_02286 [Haematococcus lacustris]
MFAKGADVLYTMTGCMALNPADCLPPDNPFYPVQGVYHQAVVMHIITFVSITAESRRIAELLSHLPPELDVEALVAGALKAHISESDPQVGHSH